MRATTLIVRPRSQKSGNMSGNGNMIRKKRLDLCKVHSTARSCVINRCLSALPRRHHAPGVHQSETVTERDRVRYMAIIYVHGRVVLTCIAQASAHALEPDPKRGPTALTPTEMVAQHACLWSPHHHPDIPLCKMDLATSAQPQPAQHHRRLILFSSDGSPA